MGFLVFSGSGSQHLDGGYRPGLGHSRRQLPIECLSTARSKDKIFSQNDFATRLGAPTSYKGYTPPKSNIDTKNDGFRMYLVSNMAILGIHVSFRGCNPYKMAV